MYMVENGVIKVGEGKGTQILNAPKKNTLGTRKK